MDKKLIERDLREEITYWIQVQQDAHWRGGEGDLKTAEYAAKQRRRFQEKLNDLWDEMAQEAFHHSNFDPENEKQPSGSYPVGLNTLQTKSIIDSLTRFGGMRNEYVS